MRAALARELRMEVAGNLGICAGGVFFDMAKFCDSLDPMIVLEKAMDKGFHPVVLLLGLEVHMAPRVLKAGGHLSEIVYPSGSIIAGCGLSVSWTRATLYDMLDEAHRGFRPQEVTTESWVDDLTTVILGSERSCIDNCQLH